MDLRSKLNMYKKEQQRLFTEGAACATNVAGAESSVRGSDAECDSRDSDAECDVRVELYANDFEYGGYKVSELSDIDSSFISALTDDCTAVDASDLLFLDTETTGLSFGAGTVAFLTGIGYFTDEGFVVKQFLMRDYDEEPSMLRCLEYELRSRGTLVTYNGKAFDMNLLEGRFIMNARRAPQMERHIDLLHLSRRVWRDVLDNCRLVTIENTVLREERTDDIPGALIPEMYFKFLYEKDLSLLNGILRHNKLDIITMAGILKYLADLFRNPEIVISANTDVAQDVAQAVAQNEIFGVGNFLESIGEGAKAEQLYMKCINSRKDRTSVRAIIRIAAMRRKAGDYEGAVRYWKMLIEIAPNAWLYPYIEVAKYYEHRVKDPFTALEFVNAARSIIINAPKIRVWNEDILSGIEHRKRRLENKIQAIHGGARTDETR